MTSACLHCGSTEEERLGGIELGPDGSSDERWIGLLRCRGCRAAFVYFYEESRRGRLDDERSHGSLSPLEETLALRLAALLAACPAPRSERCACEAHRLLRSNLDIREVLAVKPPSRPPSEPSLVRPSLYLVVLMACTVWSVHVGARPRWACLLLLPPVILTFAWVAFTRHARPQISGGIGGWVALALGVALGLAAVWRWGG
jgi:hypothetical protein